MHSQFIRSVDRQLISEEDTFVWLSKKDKKGETGSKITTAQDQALQTKFHATKILQTGTDCKCRLCQQFYESRTHYIIMPNIGERTIHKES